MAKRADPPKENKADIAHSLGKDVLRNYPDTGVGENGEIVEDFGVG